MAPTIPKNRSSTTRRANAGGLVTKFYKKYCNWEFLTSLIFDPVRLPIVSVGILLAELVLNVFVVQRVRYTEIDWIAYMQECEGFLNGTTNYSLLKGSCLSLFALELHFNDEFISGDTGPLVYPAGFVYIYTLLYYLTNNGQNIRLAQYVFIGIYLLQMYLVLKIYSKSRKVPPYVMVLSAFTSYRIHSIYVLRLFNDPIAVLFFYAALNFYLNGRWTLGSVFLSLGVSVKMNILLFAPAILLFYIANLGYVKTIKQLIVCASIQLILGLPFLLTYPIEYIKGSFDLGRIFEHKWTVNYRFLPRETFENRYFHISLLALHLLLLAAFSVPAYRYFQSYSRLRALQKQLQPQIDAQNLREAKKRNKPKAKKEKEPEEEMSPDQKKFLDSFEATLKKSSGMTSPPKKVKEEEEEEEQSDSPIKYEIFFDKAIQLALLPIFLANFIGVICARSLHYQFYVWYFHSLPYLVWFTDYSLSLKFLILGLIEFAWNTYPSTDLSSTLLHVSHWILLFGISRKLLKVQQEMSKIKIQ